MNRVLAFAASFSLLAGALGACDYAPPGPPLEDPVAIAVEPATVEVVDAGAGSQEVLAYSDIKAKQEVTFTLEVDTTLSNGGAGNHTETTLPLTAKVSAASKPKEGQKEATRNAFFTVGTPAQAELSEAEGFQFGWRALDSGQITSYRLAAPIAADDGQRTALEGAIRHLVYNQVIFPAEPVGVGAVWTVTAPLPDDDNWEKTWTYTLNSRDGDSVRLGVDINQRHVSGRVKISPDVTLDLVSTEATTHGELDIDLSTPLPVGGGVDYRIENTYSSPENKAPASAAVRSVSRFS